MDSYFFTTDIFYNIRLSKSWSWWSIRYTINGENSIWSLYWFIFKRSWNFNWPFVDWLFHRILLSNTIDWGVIYFKIRALTLY